MNNADLIRPLEGNNQQSLSLFTYKKSFLIFGLVIILGISSGYLLNYLGKISTNNKNNSTTKMLNDNNVDEVKGIPDKKTFKDDATGILQEGGKYGEGSFHLERPGGESQNVYLTSSTVDLSEYIGKKVTVYGETFAAQKVGWLMDVGLIEVSQ